MSTKFFSLLHNQSIHIAPKTKTIKANDFSSLLNAQELVTATQQDAETYKKEIVAEIEALKEQAERSGFEEGFKQWTDKILELENEIKQVRKEVEKAIIPVALKAAKKIVGRELELSENAILDIVSSNLKAVATHRKITIYVNKKDVEILEAHRPRLKDLFESLEVMYIRERADIERGGCVIETEGGIINAKLENQWRVLENAFELMMKAKEVTPQESKKV